MDQRLARVTRAAPLLAALLLCSVMAPGASAHATAAQHRPAPAATMRDATAGAVTNTTAAEHVEPSSFAYGRFGAVQLFRPSGSPTSVTLLLAGDAGWDATLGALADALVGHGSVVVGIDGQRYLEAIDQPGDGCLFIGFDFEDLSHAVQRRLGLRDYLVPVLAGAGNGAALAAIVAAQSPQGTYAGLLSVAFRPELALRREPCGAPGLAWRVQPGAAPARGTAAATATSTSSAAAIVAATGTGPDAAAGGLLLQPAARRSTPWVMLQDVGDSAFTLQAARRFAAASAATTVVPLRRIGTGASEGARAGAALGSGATAADPGTLGAAWLAAQQSLATSAARRAPASLGDLGDLPLHEVPATANTNPGATAAPDLFAVLLTGDGGWAGLDQEVAATLARAGVPVVALNSLKYFWQKHEPEAAARDLQRIVERYGAAWQRHHVALVGYSFGANVLPFLYRRLPATTRARVRSVTLLAPEHAAQFEFHVSSWLPAGGARGAPLRPEIEAMGGVRVLCIHPLEEGSSPCASARLPGLVDVALSGGHHFGGDYQGLAARILQASVAPSRAQ